VLDKATLDTMCNVDDNGGMAHRMLAGITSHACLLGRRAAPEAH
jgi:hypothetical protein